MTKKNKLLRVRALVAGVALAAVCLVVTTTVEAQAAAGTRSPDRAPEAVGGVGRPAPNGEPAPNIPDGKPHAFTFGGPDNSQFLLDGQPLQLRSGEIHPQRVPRPYWRHRIKLAKAMGLNTIAIYVFWNGIEREEGKYDFTGPNDVGEFLRLAREEGLWVLLRPGPYCCGEWDLGGIPVYLLRYPDLKLRTLEDARYTKAVANYLGELAKVVRPHLCGQGGAVLLVQLENEYGSYQRRDTKYIPWLRDLWTKAGVAGPFYTSDGAAEHFLKGVVVPGVAVGLDPGENESHWGVARKMNPGVPVFSSETYPGWLRHWGEGNWSPNGGTVGHVKWYMDTKKSFNLYVFHGGTNFGFTAGANSGGKGYEPDVTSYDYASPLDEQGRPTAAYHALRKQLAAYLPAGQTLPEVPAPIPATAIPEIKLQRWSSLWDNLPAPQAAESPAFFESLGQNQGMMVYRAKLPAGEAATLNLANLHDYAQVFVDGKFIGAVDRRKGGNTVHVFARSAEATLDVLVEAMGHINFTIAMEHDRKGMYGTVKLGNTELKGWQMFPLPLKDDWITALPKSAAPADRPGGVFKGTFTLATVADTFLDMSKYKKGTVWVNGHNLGRYWAIGPQQRLYCPAEWLKQGANTFVVLDLDLTEPPAVDGKPERN